MPAPAACTITGTAYLPTGEVQTNAYLNIIKVYLDGAIISSEVRIVSSTNGVFEFTLPRGSIAYLFGNVIGFNTRTGGHAVEIPDAASATLESLLPAITHTANNVSQGQLTEIDERVTTLEDAGYITDGDTRLTDARTPTGGAGGVLSGTFPSPGFAVNMATQAELDSVDARVGALEAGGAVGAILAAASAGFGTTVGASTTAYLTFAHAGSSVASTGPTFGAESSRQIISPVAGTLANLYVRTGTAQAADGDLVLTIRINGVDTGIVITIAANSAAGTFSDTTHTAILAAGDLISIKGVNAATGTSASLSAWSILIQ